VAVVGVRPRCLPVPGASSTAEPERLVLTDAWDEHLAEWHHMLKRLHAGESELAREAPNTVTFDAHDGMTRLMIRALFDSVPLRDAMVNMGMEDGWSESLDRLEELLGSR